MGLMRWGAGVAGVSAAELGVGLGLIAGSLAAGLAMGGVATYLLVHMPEDHLDALARPEAPPSSPRWRRVAVKCGRNALGGTLIATGAVLAIPSIPPGKSLIAIGAALLDFAEKRRLERRLLGRPKVLARVNRIRAAFHRPPLRGDPA